MAADRPYRRGFQAEIRAIDRTGGGGAPSVDALVNVQCVFEPRRAAQRHRRRPTIDAGKAESYGLGKSAHGIVVPLAVQHHADDLMRVSAVPTRLTIAPLHRELMIRIGALTS